MTQPEASVIIDQATGPDFVAELFARLRLLPVGVPQAVLEKIEIDMRREFGGCRQYICKSGKILKKEKQAALRQDMLTSMTDAEIMAKHGVSRSEYYRVMKAS